MIITDPSLSPSKRLLEVLNKFFFEKNFTFRKARYERVYENRIEIVYPFFLKWGHLVSGRIHWSTSFIEIEKILKQINESKQRIIEPTIAQNLVNYSVCRKNNGKDSFDLYDQTTHQYDNFSINRAAEDIIESYQAFISPFFNKFINLEKVENELNSLPIKRTEFMNIQKQITTGLILSKKYSSNNFEEISNSYKSYLANSKYTDKEEFEKKLDLTIEYLRKKEIDFLD